MSTDIYAASRKLPVPQARSLTVSPGFGAMTSTIAWINGRGVKYWPAPGLGVLGVFLQQTFVKIGVRNIVARRPRNFAVLQDEKTLKLTGF
jgi:hypothetical protein